MKRIIWSVLLVSLMGIIVGCGAETSSESPRVYFVELADGDTVSSPVLVKMGTEEFTVEPAGESHDGAGHLHLIVNDACIAAGEVIPNNETHLHFGDGSIETELVLDPGEYTLCLQAADGAHTAFENAELQKTITITVVE